LIEQQLVFGVVVTHNVVGVFLIEGGVGTTILTLKDFAKFKCSTFDVGQGDN
jgi:hypothetical protein